VAAASPLNSKKRWTFFLGPFLHLKLVLTHVGTQDKASVAKTPASIVATDILKLGAFEVAKRQGAKSHFLLLQALLKVTPEKSKFFFRGVVGHRILNGQVGHRILNGRSVIESLTASRS